jgi:sugar lactone lactonase YvrE
MLPTDDKSSMRMSATDVKKAPFLRVAAVASLALVVLGPLAAASPGDLFEADFSSGIIYKFDPSGVRKVFASGLHDPEGMAHDVDGNFYVSETGTGVINKFTPDGTRSTFAAGLNGPASLVFDDSGNLFDADFFGNVIYEFAPDGTRTTFATGLNGPANLIFNSLGELFVADFQSGNVYKFTAGGTRTTFASGTGNPHGLAFDALGNLFVANFTGGTILKFTPGGTRTTFASGLNGPHGIAFNSTGDLFTADYNSGAIFHFTPSGMRSTFATGLANPANLQFEPPRDVTTANNLLNLSTRAFVGTDPGVLIGGFILQGTASSTMVIRAIGPSLIARGVSDALEDPFLEVYDSAGTLLFSNDNWQTGPDAASIQAAGLAPDSALEAAVRVTLPAGAYTAIVRGVGGTQPEITGVGLVELYDLQLSDNRAVNISTRGNVLSGDGVMIAGCIIGGSQAKELVFRGLGPSLEDHGVSDAVGNPQLQVVSAEGVVLAANDDWEDGADAAAIAGSGLGPESPLEAAIRAILAPGNYTAIESPAPQDSGIGLIEVYDLTPFAKALE